MKLKEKLRLAYKLLTAKHFFLYVADKKGFFEQASYDLKVMQADLIIGNLTYAANIAEQEAITLNQYKNIINGISPN